MVGLFLMLKKSIKSEQEWRSYGLFWLFSAKKGWKINLLKKPIKRGRRARNANRKNGLAFYPTPWEPWKLPGPPQLWARWSNPSTSFFFKMRAYWRHWRGKNFVSKIYCYCPLNVMKVPAEVKYPHSDWKCLQKVNDFRFWLKVPA